MAAATRTWLDKDYHACMGRLSTRNDPSPSLRVFFAQISPDNAHEALLASILKGIADKGYDSQEN